VLAPHPHVDRSGASFPLFDRGVPGDFSAVGFAQVITKKSQFR
jgi:hypothetical protein